MKPILKVAFEPRHGYWDGGERSGGEFEPELLHFTLEKTNNGHPGKNNTIRWGCYCLNYWFNCGSGRSWKEAAAIAKRRLCHLLGIPATVEVVWMLERRTS